MRHKSKQYKLHSRIRYMRIMETNVNKFQKDRIPGNILQNIKY